MRTGNGKARLDCNPVHDTQPQIQFSLGVSRKINALSFRGALRAEESVFVEMKPKRDSSVTEATSG
jgi:hypothetical protein